LALSRHGRQPIRCPLVEEEPTSGNSESPDFEMSFADGTAIDLPAEEETLDGK
jgi:hypothetical protein